MSAAAAATSSFMTTTTPTEGGGGGPTLMSKKTKGAMKSMRNDSMKSIIGIIGGGVKPELGGGGMITNSNGPDGTWEKVRNFTELKPEYTSLKVVVRQRNTVVKETLELNTQANNWRPGAASVYMQFVLPAVVILGTNWLRVKSFRFSTDEEEKASQVWDKSGNRGVFVSFYGVQEVLLQNLGLSSWGQLTSDQRTAADKFVWYRLPPFYAVHFQQYWKMVVSSGSASSTPYLISSLFGQDESVMVLLRVNEVKKTFRVKEKEGGRTYETIYCGGKTTLIWTRKEELGVKMYREMFPWDKSSSTTSSSVAAAAVPDLKRKASSSSSVLSVTPPPPHAQNPSSTALDEKRRKLMIERDQQVLKSQLELLGSPVLGSESPPWDTENLFDDEDLLDDGDETQQQQHR